MARLERFSKHARSNEKKISGSCIFVPCPNSRLRSTLSTLPAISAQNKARAIPRQASPVVIRMIAAGTHTSTPPTPGMIDTTVITERTDGEQAPLSHRVERLRDSVGVRCRRLALRGIAEDYSDPGIRG
jgi:hypothetical protein